MKLKPDLGPYWAVLGGSFVLHVPMFLCKDRASESCPLDRQHPCAHSEAGTVNTFYLQTHTRVVWVTRQIGKALKSPSGIVQTPLGSSPQYLSKGTCSIQECWELFYWSAGTRGGTRGGRALLKYKGGGIPPASWEGWSSSSLQNEWERGFVPTYEGGQVSRWGWFAVFPAASDQGFCLLTHCGTEQGITGGEGSRSVWPLGQPTRAAVHT